MKTYKNKKKTQMLQLRYICEKTGYKSDSMKYNVFSQIYSHCNLWVGAFGLSGCQYQIFFHQKIEK